MNVSTTFPLIVALLGQAPAPSPDKPDDRAARLEFMKKSVATFDVHSIDNPRVTYRLEAEPVLRFTDPSVAFGPPDGANFFWIGEDDRPVAAVQVHVDRKGVWHQEFTLLGTSPLIASSTEVPDWSPARGGVELKPLTGAPKPAMAAPARLRQMQALAQEFSAECMIPPASWNQLRRLTKPLARYGKPGADVIDGAIFVFVLSTDPEVYLMIEARQGRDGPEWQYALAPMTTRDVKCSRKGEEVWSLPRRWAESRNPTAPFHNRDLTEQVGPDRSKGEGARP